MPVRRMFVEQDMPPDVHVLAVEIESNPAAGLSIGVGPYSSAVGVYRALMKDIYKSVNGTWGHTKLQEVIVGNYNKNTYTSPTAFRGYVFLKEAQDVLFLKLKMEQKLKPVIIWPAGLKFTIHEVDYDT